MQTHRTEDAKFYNRDGIRKMSTIWQLALHRVTSLRLRVSLVHVLFWRSIIELQERPRSDIPPHLLSHSDSDNNVFEGFNARDIRPLADIASKALLFCSTPKAKRVRVARDNSHYFRLECSRSSSLSDEKNFPAVEHQTRSRTSSSSSSVECEIAPNVFRELK